MRYYVIYNEVLDEDDVYLCQILLKGTLQSELNLCTGMNSSFWEKDRYEDWDSE